MSGELIIVGGGILYSFIGGVCYVKADDIKNDPDFPNPEWAEILPVALFWPLCAVPMIMVMNNTLRRARSKRIAKENAELLKREGL